MFVVVTKCDKINGFREFFDSLNDPQLQQQMMGWSNPDPLDTPFKPELVDQHLEKVAQRLRRRRFGLLLDPVPKEANSRRSDEVDSLYALPHSLGLLGPRLRRYLETIFVAGEWSAKPLFLRGIYFSSSMREGSALDAELAQALGVPVDELPEGKLWERDRSYFLRDLFIDKVFREKGLVTRASNTSRMVRMQQAVLFGFIFAAVTIFVTVAWLGTRSLDKTVKRQSEAWVAATNWWDDKTWKESVIARNPDGSYGTTVVNEIEVGGKKVPLSQFHVQLQELATNELKKNWMIPGLAEEYNQNSKRAQRVVFEGGVLKPLADAARKKLNAAAGGSLEKGEPDALAALIKLEADILSRGKGTNTGTLSTESAKSFLGALLSYVTGKDAAVDTNLVNTFAWTYTSNPQAKGSWPPAWLTGASSATNNSLAGNPALQAGLQHFSKNFSSSVQEQLVAWNQAAELRNVLRKYRGC